MTTDRRTLLACACGGAASLLVARAGASAPDPQHRAFVAEAQRMMQQAIAAGDQPYGAVVVRDGRIVGYGPSRVVIDRNPDAHAERIALRDARQRLNTADLSGATMYSTSRPCPACEHAAAEAGLERMYFGPVATDAGRPQPRR